MRAGICANDKVYNRHRLKFCQKTLTSGPAHVDRRDRSRPYNAHVVGVARVIKDVTCLSEGLASEGIRSEGTPGCALLKGNNDLRRSQIRLML